MNKFELTDRAKKIVEYYEDISTPSSVQECIEGVFSLSCDNTPNITQGLRKCFDFIQELKHEIRNDYQIFKKQYPDKYLFSNFVKDLEFFLENCTVWLVTTEDVENTEEVRVNNIFTNESQIIPIPYPEGKSDEEKAGWITDYLGVYTPKTGSIFLFVDLIYNPEENKENPELLFQKVLLHEFIHAFLDIVPRIIKGGQVKNQIVINNIEEPYDNTLVLYSYVWSEANKDIFRYVSEFIEGQPYPYNEAINYFQQGLSIFRIILKEFLKSKFLILPLNSLIFPSIKYSIDGEGMAIPKKIIPKIQSLLPKDLSLLKDEDIANVREAFKHFFGDLLSYDVSIFIDEIFSPVFPKHLSLKYSCQIDNTTITLIINLIQHDDTNFFYPNFDLVGRYHSLKIIFSYKVYLNPFFVIKTNFKGELSSEAKNLLKNFYNTICQFDNVFSEYDDLAYTGELMKDVRTKLIDLFPQLNEEI